MGYAPSVVAADVLVTDYPKAYISVFLAKRE